MKIIAIILLVTAIYDTLGTIKILLGIHTKLKDMLKFKEFHRTIYSLIGDLLVIIFVIGWWIK
jgi:hypothetical protein